LRQGAARDWSRAIIAHRIGHPFAIDGDAGIPNIRRPRRIGLRHAIHLLGVAGTHPYRIDALDILRELIVTIEARQASVP
jgi:hypothetical protein